MSAIEIFKLFGSILINNEEAIKSLSSTEKKFEEIGGKLEKFGKGMTLKVTTPIIAVGTAAAKFATDLNKDMSLINTLIPGQSERILELKDKIRDVAIETGKFTDDIASGTYDVISAYGDASDTMDKVSINAKAATAGVATTSDALNLSSAIMKGYGDTSAEANAKVMDLAFTTLKLGQTSFPDLAASMGKVVPMSNELGIAQEELFAIYATGTGVTGNASEVSTQYQAVLKSLMTPTKSMTNLMKDMGVEDGKAMIAKYGLGDSIKMIVEESKNSKTPLSDYIGSINGQVIALALAGEQSEVFKEKLDELQNSTGAMETAFEEVTEGINETGFSWQQSMVKMQVASQKFGDTMAPILDKGAELISKVADKLNGLTPAQRETIVQIAALAAAIGPAILVFGKLTTGVGKLIGGIKLLMPVLSALISPIGLVVVAVAGFIAIIVHLWQTNEEFRDNVKKLWEELKKFFETTLEGIKKIIEGFIKIAQEIWDKYGESIKKVTENIWNAIKTTIDTVIKVIQNIIKTITGLISGDWKTAWEGIKGIFKSIWEGMKNLLPNLLEGIYSVIKLSFNVFKDLGRGMFSMIWEGMKGIWTSISNWVSDKVSWLTDKLAFWRKSNDEMDKGSSSGNKKVSGSHRSGLTYVPYDGYIAELHKGERVLTARENEQTQQPIIQPARTEIHLHVGTLIADDFGLRQLERKLRDIRVEEDDRLGVNSV